MIMVGMHAARRQQPQQVTGTAALLQLGDEIQEAGIFIQFAGKNGGADTGQVLGDDAPGAQVHMADFGIPHLTRGQADFFG